MDTTITFEEGKRYRVEIFLNVPIDEYDKVYSGESFSKQWEYEKNNKFFRPFKLISFSTNDSENRITIDIEVVKTKNETDIARMYLEHLSIYFNHNNDELKKINIIQI
ncbi:hypothetical protein [Bacillus suaedaesalsae]|uniref:Uncharacterized protein n=1 Tax=Bacillus suaedaesalsae TaxID=2810349 RepID=A0ABS2DL35_9BACI|nr:hypothetical protein [Bacillus suaedaesalsae]MBM6619195.1 hypothetical protein [Bacillus suaedaesalsae]